MKKEIKIEKTLKTVESMLGEQLQPFQRELLRSMLLELEDHAGFSDENVPDSPRPVSNSPRETGKNSEFGPTELR